MFAIIAAILFAIALLLELLSKAGLGDVITVGALTTAGLLCVALHLAGIGTAWHTRAWSRRRR